MAIIGGGLIGCSIALELAREKLKVVVLDKQEFGREASWAAAPAKFNAVERAQEAEEIPIGSIQNR